MQNPEDIENQIQDNENQLQQPPLRSPVTTFQRIGGATIGFFSGGLAFNIISSFVEMNNGNALFFVMAGIVVGTSAVGFYRNNNQCFFSNQPDNDRNCQREYCPCLTNN